MLPWFCIGALSLVMFCADTSEEIFHKETLQLLADANAAEVAGDRALVREKWQLLMERSESPHHHNVLRAIQSDPKLKLAAYERFIIGCHLAGFGMLSRIGPNSLNDHFLDTYLKLQSGIRVPSGSERRIAWSDSVGRLKVTVPKSATDDLSFQEILWVVIKNHDLEFTLRNENEFLLHAKSE